MAEILFYRCVTCNKPVSQWDIKEKGACPTCGQHKVRPTNLNFWEKLKEIWKHPKVWEWKDELR